ncbi:MAG: competence/damage-inducible protein A [Verrucomicrobiota bacterium]
MIIEVINTGTELLLGQVLNTHLRYFSEQLALKGLQVSRQATVPDGSIIELALLESLARADLILITGGLGPTTDDLTRQAIAKVTKKKLTLDTDTLETIKVFFKKRDYEMPESNTIQAMIPEGADILKNNHGTAPGLRLQHKNKWIICLPGPPRELYPMFSEQIMPWFDSLLPHKNTIQTNILRLTGLGESLAQDMIMDSLNIPHDVDIGYCARLGELDIRLVSASSESLSKVVTAVTNLFNEFIYANEIIKIEEAVVRLARGLNKKITTAESCTGGLVAHRLTNIPGSSEVFCGGWVTYSNTSKSSELNVPQELIDEHGAVSENVAKAMAIGALQKSKADLSIALTGIAGPGGGTSDKPVGLVYIACASSHGDKPKITVLEKRLVQNRESFKVMASQIALDLLRRDLQTLVTHQQANK